MLGDEAPEPVVLAGGVIDGLPVELAPVVIGGGLPLLLALVPSLFQPATTMKAIRASTATPATQPQMPPVGAS
jgi:hypothetical protein